MIRGIIKSVEGNKGSGLLLITVELDNGDQQRLVAEGGMLARALGECFGTEYTGKEIYYTENHGLLESFEPVQESE